MACRCYVTWGRAAERGRCRPAIGRVEFNLPAGKMIELLRDGGHLEVTELIEVRSPQTPVRFSQIAVDRARKYPREEVWRARKCG